MEQNNKWGFLRETQKDAIKAGKDKDTGLHRTGLEEYLQVIFPNVRWEHDKQFGEHNGEKYRIRPDYRNEELKLIIEFDGLQHYSNPDRILKDYQNTQIYKTYGYKVVRIPYFIQLTNEVVENMFGIHVDENLFNPQVPSMGIKGRNSPRYLCREGILRMAKDFLQFPQQYEVNYNALKQAELKGELTGIELLENEVKALSQCEHLHMKKDEFLIDNHIPQCRLLEESLEKSYLLIKAKYENLYKERRFPANTECLWKYNNETFLCPCFKQATTK